MNELRNPSKKIEYSHYVEYRGKKYTRKEVIAPKAFSWDSTPDKLEDIHTISWQDYDYDVYQKNGGIHYFSCDHGWARNGKMDKSNPIPNIEKMFKKTIGKDLMYFNKTGESYE
jgi:hypothetical protein